MHVQPRLNGLLKLMLGQSDRATTMYYYSSEHPLPTMEVKDLIRKLYPSASKIWNIYIYVPRGATVIELYFLNQIKKKEKNMDNVGKLLFQILLHPIASKFLKGLIFMVNFIVILLFV